MILNKDIDIARGGIRDETDEVDTPRWGREEHPPFRMRYRTVACPVPGERFVATPQKAPVYRDFTDVRSADFWPASRASLVGGARTFCPPRVCKRSRYRALPGIQI